MELDSTTRYGGSTGFETPASAAPAAHHPRKVFWLSLAGVAAYFAAAIACLWQWGSPRPWSRVDFFSGGFLVISLVWVYATIRFHRAIFRSREVMREASGVSYDPEMMTWINIFAVAELSVFFDYGHLHLVPQLENPVLQTIGIAMYFLGAVWLIWTDRCLSRQFRGDLADRKVMTQGPYRFVRHPRYAALIASRIAFALCFASILAWGFTLGWLFVNLRRVRLEEAHLRDLFGPDYDVYASRTSRFLPGIY
jgi:protein-S-isoprenylcysteine O-methyltransferase Ste14